MRRLRWAVRNGHVQRTPDGTLTVHAFGARVGYWPCLRALFLEVVWNTKRYQVWFGDEYKGSDK